LRAPHSRARARRLPRASPLGPRAACLPTLARPLSLSLSVSLSTLKNWVKELQTLGPESIVIAVCGNKLDQEDRRVRAPRAARAPRLSLSCARVRASRNPPTRACRRRSPSTRTQEVRREEAEAFAREIDGIFFETSAKTAVNVSKMFESISRKLPALSAPAFDNLADLRGGNVDPRAGGGKAGKEGGGKGGCC
jgi:GTPase SAR1 family protein